MHGLLLSLAGISLQAPAIDVAFKDSSTVAGIGAYQMAPGFGGGVAAADFDDDGDVDVFVATAEGTPNQLYRNISGPDLPRFEEIAAIVGLADRDRARGAVWFDADGDQRLDLLLSSDCYVAECEPGYSMLRLFRQLTSGHFVEVTNQAGLHEDGEMTRSWRHRGGSSVGDLDGDGDPDIFTAVWQGGNRIYLNRGDGSFVNASNLLGSDAEPIVATGPWQGLIHDFDGDGRLDIFSAVDYQPNRLWSQRGQVLEDIATQAGLDRAWNEMGVALGDVENDGDFDLFVTNISDDFNGELRHSTLYINDTVTDTLQFTEQSHAAGVDDAGWGWGTTFLDADNDGWLDLAATNGFINREDQSRFFLNRGNGSASFDDVSDAVGFNDTHWGSGLIAFDVDRDGDLDLMQTCQDGPLRLLINQLDRDDRHYLVVKPRSLGRFSRPLGAVVEVRAGDLTMRRLITAGTSFLSQEPAEAFFGLGAATVVDKITVRWPGGGYSTLENVAADQVITMTSQVYADGFEPQARATGRRIRSSETSRQRQ